MSAQPITVTIKLTARNRPQTIQHLARALPVTRNYAGCRYCNTYTQADDSNQIILIQGWDSRIDHQRYLEWRQQTGALNELLNLLAEPPTVEFWYLDVA